MSNLRPWTQNLGVLNASSTARIVLLDAFISVYAAPGEKIVFSDGTNLEDTDPHGQTQRRKNWAIFMEAMLYANGGTGAANGNGWYTDGSATGEFPSSCGTVIVTGTFFIEPYDTSLLDATVNYAPNWSNSNQLWGSSAWTAPGGIQIIGSGGTATTYNVNVGWSSVASKTSPRIVVWNNTFQFNPAGGPTTTTGRRHLSRWAVDNLCITRRGTATGGAIFYSGYWWELVTPPATGKDHVNAQWHIGKLTLEASTGVGASHNGAVFRDGLGGIVDFLVIEGAGVCEWGFIYTGENQSTDDSAWSAATNVQWRYLGILDSLKGALVSHADFFCDHFWLETRSAIFPPVKNPTPQLIFGRYCYTVTIYNAWIENNPGNIGGRTDDALIVLAGDDSYLTEWTTTWSGAGSEATIYELNLLNIIGIQVNAPSITSVIKMRNAGGANYIGVVRSTNSTGNPTGSTSYVIEHAPRLPSNPPVGSYDPNLMGLSGDATGPLKLIFSHNETDYVRFLPSRLGFVPRRHTTSETVSVDDIWMPHTNNGATGAITLTLPAAKPNMEFTFHSKTDSPVYAMTIKPPSPGSLAGRASQEGITILTAGQTVKVKADIWQSQSTGAWVLDSVTGVHGTDWKWENE